MRINQEKLKKALNVILIGVAISVFTALVIFIATSVSLVYEMKAEYKNDKFNITEELKEDNKQINSLRVDFINHQRENSKMFTEFKQINEQNSKEHQQIINEMNKIKYVIIKNNKTIAKDLRLLKAVGTFNVLANDTNRYNYLFKQADKEFKQRGFNKLDI